MELLTARDPLKPIGSYRPMRQKEGGPALALIADQSGNFVDASPRGYRSVITGSLSATASPWGPAVHFPGTGNNFAAVQSNAFVNMPSRSWGVTFRTTDVSKWLVLYNGSLQESGFNITASGFVVYNYYPRTITSSVAVNDGKWHTLWGTSLLQGGNVTMTLYLDGQIVAGPTTTTLTPGAEDDWLAIGVSTSSGHFVSGSLSGDIERFSIFPRALSQAEVLVETCDPNWRLRRPASPRGSRFGNVTTVTMDTPCWLDSAAMMRFDSALPIESRVGVQRDTLSTVDSLGGLRADCALPLSSLGSTRADMPLSLESLVSVLIDSLDWIDSTSPPPPLADHIGLIFQDIQTLLAGAGFAPRSAVVLSLLDDPFPAAGFPQVVITPGEFTPRDDELIGGGRYTADFRGEFSVCCWVRNATDQTYQDTNLLTDQTGGAYLLANNVVDQLLEHFPASEDTGMPLTIDGIKFEGYDEPERWSDEENSLNRSLDVGGVVTHWSFSVRLSLIGAL